MGGFFNLIGLTVDDTDYDECHPGGVSFLI
jgi:hypothetical protein